MIIDDLRELISKQSHRYSPSTNNVRRSSLRKFESFMLLKGYTEIDLDRFIEYRDFLREESYSKNTIYIYTIGTLRPLLEIIGVKDIEKFRVDRGEESRQVCLTEDQVYKVNEYKVKEEDIKKFPRIELVKDLFILQCLSGVGISDLPKLFEESICNDKICIYRKKTGNKSEIPVTKVSKSIIKKYTIKDVRKYYNPGKCIRYICKEAGLTEKVKFKYKDQEQVMPLYKLVHSHTGRHTLINILLRRGVSVGNIKKITGHSSDQSITKVYSHTDKKCYEKFSKYFNI